jgi:glycosyltransferase involved in cell wall biosynthesis
VRILFVGGDLERKGGDLLLKAFADLRAELATSATGSHTLELHMVTSAQVPDEPGVFVYHDLRPNSTELVALYHLVDIFCLPTRGDCLPMVLSEAGAAELPLVSTAIAGIPEIVKDGETGLMVALDDLPALVEALRILVERPELRSRLGSAARQLVDRQFDAVKNTHQLVELLVLTAGAGAAT